MRPLPLLTPANEWFWTSGADGRLRVQRCADCTQLVHPPVPICPRCRSRSWTPAEVSGRATVVAFTVIGYVNAVVIFFTIAFGSFFHGPAATAIGLVFVKFEHE